MTEKEIAKMLTGRGKKGFLYKVVMLCTSLLIVNLLINLFSEVEFLLILLAVGCLASGMYLAAKAFYYLIENLIAIPLLVWFFCKKEKKEEQETIAE